MDTLRCDFTSRTDHSNNQSPRKFLTLVDWEIYSPSTSSLYSSMLMATRKIILSSMLFFVSGSAFMLGIVKHDILCTISSICGIAIAINCIRDGREK